MTSSDSKLDCAAWVTRLLVLARVVRVNRGRDASVWSYEEDQADMQKHLKESVLDKPAQKNFRWAPV